MASSWSSLVFGVFTMLSIHLASSSEDDVPATIIIPLKSRFTKNPSTDPMLLFQQLASASSARVQYLKHGKSRPSLRTPIFPNSGGFHFIDVSFGTPPQTLSLLVDTGSHVVWFPCTTHYRCINCSSDEGNKKIPIFNPKLSSSSKVLHCRNPKCVYVSSPDIRQGCPRCKGRSKHCSRDCPYTIQYGIGGATGFFLLENLDFPGKTFHNFLVGCSTSSRFDSIAVAGFGNSKLSLPLQMGAKKFAYCLKSHAFDDTGDDSSKLFIDYNSGDTKGVIYTPFLESPPRYSLYYYLGVEDIMIGRKLLRIPHKYLAPGSDHRGGVMIDSGDTYGYMVKPVFNIVSAELKRQMSKYRRSFKAETMSGYSPCYNFTGEKSIKIPDLVYKFTSGASMVVAGEKYFKPFPGDHLWCFPITTDDPGILEFTPGPSVMLGNYQQVDFYVEFDLKNKRFGFRKQTC